MVGLETITEKVSAGKAYYIELIAVHRDNLVHGIVCIGKDGEKLDCLRSTIQALEYDLIAQTVSADTQLVYESLIKQIEDYTGSYTIDPNVVMPGYTVNVINPTGFIRPEIIRYADMTLLGTRYDNPDWKGHNPYLVLDNTTWLTLGADYELVSTGGFILKSTGNVPMIYEGQTIRAVAYDKVDVFSVNATIIRWGYFDTDPSALLETLPLQFTSGGSILDNAANFELDFTIAANLKWWVVKEPATNPVKINWFNTPFNNGSIPDIVFKDPLVLNGFRYYFTRSEKLIDSSKTTISFSS